MKKYRIAIVGATGCVGRTILRTIEERNFPASEIFALASSRSAGKKISCGDRIIVIEELAKFDFSRADIAIFSIGNKLSAEYAPIATAAGCVVIDNSACWRADPEVPLVIPSINPGAIAEYRHCRIIANPNCVAIPLAEAIAPLHQEYGVVRVVAATYQSVSGRGNSAIRQLYSETQDEFQGREMDSSSNSDDEIIPANDNDAPLPHRIAFNVIPQVGEFNEDGETDEEAKIRNEIQKIISPDIKVTATCVRVPVFIGHSIAVNVELATEQLPSIEQLAATMGNNPEVAAMHEIQLDADQAYFTDYLTPIECAALPLTYVSRIRKDYSNPKAFNMWVVSDNLYKGAALNAVQIAEKLIGEWGTTTTVAAAGKGEEDVLR